MGSKCVLITHLDPINKQRHLGEAEYRMFVCYPILFIRCRKIVIFDELLSYEHTAGLPFFYLLFICTCRSKAVGYNLERGMHGILRRIGRNLSINNRYFIIMSKIL